MKTKISNVPILLFLVVLFMFSLPSVSREKEEKPGDFYEKIDREILSLMKDGLIPGLSLIIVKGKEEPFIKGYGYADRENKIPVSANTVFELASCSKAFTGLAALHCAEQGLIDLDAPVNRYLPWFYALFEGKKNRDVTLKHCLNHTSGIPFGSISLIPESADADALQQTIRALSGIELKSKPGQRFEYATINYDVVAFVIETVTEKSFENYMEKNILAPAGLSNTLVGVDKENPPGHMAAGYKTGFFAARRCDAPVYRGNNAAGYILSNGVDMARWLRIQLGLIETGLAPLVEKSHRMDDSMHFNRRTLSAYGYGWNIYLEREKRIDHAGNNPNFTGFIILNPVEKTGVAVLTNSSSALTPFIAESLMSYVGGRGFREPDLQGDDLDNGSSIVAIMIGLFLLAVVVFWVSVFIDIVRGKRTFAPPTLKKIFKALLTLPAFAPFLLGLYFVPKTLAGVSMRTAMVFSPVSFTVAIAAVLTALAAGYLTSILTGLFPHRNKYIRVLPFVLLLSLLAGVANAAVIFLVTRSVFSEAGLFYQLYNFGLAFCIYITGRKLLQTKLIRITFDLIYDMRLDLLEKVFYTTYQKFEKIQRGRVFATLNDDTGQIGNSANILVQLVTSAVTTMGAFFFLATIAFWATAVTLLVVGVIATVYTIVTHRTQIYFEEARDTQNIYMGLLNGMIDGFKELSLQFHKKREYRNDVARACDDFRKKLSTALIKFVNAFLIGESLLIIVLGAVGYGIPRLFPNITPVTLMAFIMVLLFLIGPINAMLNAIPAIMRMRVAWNRIRGFKRDIPANIDPKVLEGMDHEKPRSVETISAKGLKFTYDAVDDVEKFTVGPMDFEARKGEIVFIIGGNGSGKTTLAKLLTGLYHPDEGSIEINGKAVDNFRLGEHYSVVFGDFHLFAKLYNVDLTGREEEIDDYLEMLRLQEKVVLEDNEFSTIELSGGQRKRLALMQCYLEDSPIYLFDEVAADQDPGFRRFFYRELLQRMKEEGKIVIAITHDDHYFDAADRVIKMDMGKIDIIEDSRTLKLTR
ncbi:MAG: cyclic peptide export ABC transporter [Candidatus Aminicenantes bacterium]|nr:cyclic peptide export ABC transporter [Candidatus Aminicenantes bacterium]